MGKKVVYVVDLFGTEVFRISFFFGGRMRLKKRSEKTEKARPKRGNDENGEKQGRGQAAAQAKKNAALSRRDTKRILARLAGARKFVAKLR